MKVGARFEGVGAAGGVGKFSGRHENVAFTHRRSAVTT